MTDESRLQMHPGVDTKKMGRRPLYIIAVVGALLFLYLAHSMGLLEDNAPPKPAPEPEEAAPVQTDAADSGGGRSGRRSR